MLKIGQFINVTKFGDAIKQQTNLRSNLLYMQFYYHSVEIFSFFDGFF